MVASWHGLNQLSGLASSGSIGVSAEPNCDGPVSGSPTSRTLV